MQYRVMEEHYVQEFDIWLDYGVEFQDGDLEPDLVASLLSQQIVSTLSPEGGAVWAQPENEGEDFEETEEV